MLVNLEAAHLWLLYLRHDSDDHILATIGKAASANPTTFPFTNHEVG